MKKLYLLGILFIFQIGFAQEAELFENTWYLRTVMLDDLAEEYVVSEIDPPISPYLLISEDFNFNGEGACNTFSGEYDFFPPNGLSATSFLATTDDCGVPIHNRFETSYFTFISNEFSCDILLESQDYILILGNVLGGIAVFRSEPLAITDFLNNEFTLYPNPVNDVLFFKSAAAIGHLTIKILTVEGRLLSTQNLEFERQASLDVSTLSKGVYFLNIEEENGNTSIKKFIKN